MLALAAIVLLGHGLFFLAPPLIGLGLIAVVGVLLWRAGGRDREPGGTAAAKIGLGLLLLVVAARRLRRRGRSAPRWAAARSSPAS